MRLDLGEHSSIISDGDNTDIPDHDFIEIPGFHWFSFRQFKCEEIPCLHSITKYRLYDWVTIIIFFFRFRKIRIGIAFVVFMGKVFIF